MAKLERKAPWMKAPRLAGAGTTRADSSHSNRQAATVRAPVSSSSGSEKTDSSGAQLMLMNTVTGRQRL